MQALLRLLQQGVEVHGIILALHWAQATIVQVDVGLPAEPPQTSNGNLGGGLSSLPRRLLIRPARGGGASLLVGNEATPLVVLHDDSAVLQLSE